MAERDIESPEKVRAYLSGAREGVGRGLKLTSQLLGLMKQDGYDAHEDNVNALLRFLVLSLK